MIDGSGPTCSALSSDASQLGFLLRTFLASSPWASTTFWLTWKLKATKRGRLYFQLQPSARRTSGSASSSSHDAWPTPITNNARGRAYRDDGTPYPNRSPGVQLADAVKIWPTPTSSDSNGVGLHGAGAPDLRTAVWFTPSAHDAKGSRTLPPGTTPAGKRPDGKKAQVGLDNQARTFPTPTARDWKGQGREAQLGNIGRLNPDWVEALMGYPPGWTLPSASPASIGPRSRTKSSTSGKPRARRPRGSGDAPA
jgi:hypothetical protein